MDIQEQITQLQRLANYWSLDFDKEAQHLPTSQACIEAADIIEKLNAVVEAAKDLVDLWEKGKLDGYKPNYILKYALDALEES